MSELDSATRAAVLTVAMAAAEDVGISGYLGEFQISYMNGGYELLFKDALREAQERCEGERGLTFVSGLVDDWRKERKAHIAT